MRIRYCGIAALLSLVACLGTDFLPTAGPSTDSNADGGGAAPDDGGSDEPNEVVDGAPGNRDDAGDENDAGDGNDAGDTGSPSCTLDPSRIDVPGNGLDEDCSGQADDDSPLCDMGLAIASSDPFDAAKAIGLCKKVDAASNAWGVIDARYVLPDGTAAGGASANSWGLLTSFGANNTPRAGQALLALSSGTARAPGQPSYVAPSPGASKGYGHARPSGFPRAMPSCSGLELHNNSYDGIALELRVRVPSNAKSLSFMHQYFATDYSDLVCSSFNDPFVVILTPKPAGSADGNVVLDAKGGALTPNANTLVRACTAGTHNGLTYTCPLGTSPLTGTGFEGHASTGWLKTTVPVTGGTEITLRFSIWDSGDANSDSTALIDRFAFSTEAAAAMSTVGQ